MRAIRFAVPLLALAAAGCATPYIEGKYQPMTVEVTPASAVCDVVQGDAYAGTVRHGVGQVTLAKGFDTVTVRCAALGYETRTVTLHSSVAQAGKLRCWTDDLCEPALESGKLNQYPQQIKVHLTELQPTPAQKRAAEKAKEAAEMAAEPPVPAVTPAGSGPDTVASSKHLPPLPVEVQRLRVGRPDDGEQVAGMPKAMESKEKIAPLDATFADAPLGTWRTTSDGVQAWWGRAAAHSFAMPPTALLSLQRTKGDWGLFDYRGKDGRRGRVWIALNDVRLAD